MLYAVVDIETTGHPYNRITEIAILVTDGKNIVKEYEQLVNPQCPIPANITLLTGIDEQMVRNAPTFDKIHDDVLEVIGNSIFVAHSVEFDYGQISRQMKECGVNLALRKLCTVRLSRKHFKGMRSYSLGKLCANLDIPLENRHRAIGDARATCILLHRILSETAGLFA